MIYPSLYRYNAPYRGPRDSKELSKTLTSIKYDLQIAGAEAEKHKGFIYGNINHALGITDTAVTGSMNTVVELNEIQQQYEGIDSLINKLRIMEKQLDVFLKNL